VPSRGIMSRMPDAPGLRRAPVDGGHVEYVLHGSGDPMLFIHGAGIADAFLPLVNQPPLAGIQQIHYRRRGYGQSTAVAGPPESFMARAASDAARLLAHLRVDPVHVVGHSSGALIALDLACDTPLAVRSLALLEPPLLGVASTGAHMAALTPAVERFAAGDHAGAIDGLFSVVFGPGWRPGADRAVPGGVQQAETDAATFFEFELPGVAAWQFDSLRAEQVRQPVLFMMGSATVPFHKEAGDRIREWWPNSEHYVVAGATHALQVAEPAGVANGLAQFIARH
jgi:pimeloyl-ACP methyl ester carboxylesterase